MITCVITVKYNFPGIPAYPLLSGAIRLGCKIAIKVSERV